MSVKLGVRRLRVTYSWVQIVYVFTFIWQEKVWTIKLLYISYYMLLNNKKRYYLGNRKYKIYKLNLPKEIVYKSAIFQNIENIICCWYSQPQAMLFPSSFTTWIVEWYNIFCTYILCVIFFCIQKLLLVIILWVSNGMIFDGPFRCDCTVQIYFYLYYLVKHSINHTYAIHFWLYFSLYHIGYLGENPPYYVHF